MSADSIDGSAATPSPGNVIDMAVWASRREAAFRSRVDETTKTLHYALMPIKTAIILARRDWKLPDLE